ncbi:MAG TPA: response regulator [Rhodobacteraceae bacterium]|nr:response regulator [Paracoccaceae bacterium]
MIAHETLQIVNAEKFPFKPLVKANGVSRSGDSLLNLQGQSVLALAKHEHAETGAEKLAIRTILVVDDSRAQRHLLVRALTRQGYVVSEAASGEEALESCKTNEFDLILSDWMMPGMDGLAFCRHFRELDRENYGYFILLTSKNEKGAVARGLDVGADDFLTKPVRADELLARINAGDRILRMERELTLRNLQVSAKMEEISALYEALDRDLFEARKMQQSLLREPHRDFGRAEASLLLKPCGHVGGDLVGFFRAGQNKIGFYSIDVSGHGVASALLTARLASYLSDGAPAQNVALVQDHDGRYVHRPPSEVANLLNILMIEDMETDLYFTMLLGFLDLDTGRVDYSQCGHPNPALISKNHDVRFFGEGGMPIGLIPDAQFEQDKIVLKPGERLLFYSDGFTECENDRGEQLEEEGLQKLLCKNADLQDHDLFTALVWELDLFSGDLDFGDDLSCVLLHYRGSEPET